MVDKSRIFSKGTADVPKRITEEMTRDQILYGDGFFQKITLVFACISSMAYTSQTASFWLLFDKLDHWCSPPDDLANMSSAEWKNAAIPVKEDGSFSQCTMYDPPVVSNLTFSRNVVPCRSWQFSHKLRGNTIISEWTLVCHRYWMVVFARLLFMSGTIIPIPVLGVGCDSIGRLPVACGCAAVLLITGFASSLTNSYGFFVSTRFAVIAGTGGVMNALFVLLYEVATPEKRSLFVIVAAGIGLAVVPFIYNAVTLVPLNWKMVQLLITAPTSLLVGVFYLIEESPRWLLATWNIKSAERVALWAVNTGRVSRCTREVLNEAANEVKRCDFGSESPVANALLLLRPKHRRNSLILCFVWFASGFCYFVITLDGVLVSYGWSDVIFITSTVPLFLVTYAFIVRFEPKNVLVIVCLLYSGLCALLTATDGDQPTFLNSVLTLTIKLLGTLVVGVVVILTLQLFPTVVRATGFFFVFACGRLGAATAAIVMEANAGQSKYLMIGIVAIITCFRAVAFQALPKTSKGCPAKFLATSASPPTTKFIQLHSTDPQRSGTMVATVP